MGKPPSPWPLQVPRRKESGATAGCITGGDVAGVGESFSASIAVFLWKMCMCVTLFCVYEADGSCSVIVADVQNLVTF